MGQKINPILLRIGIHRKIDSFWFNERNYKESFFQDIFTRNYIKSVFHYFKKYPANIIIRHFPHKISIHSFVLPWNCFNKGFRFQLSKTLFSIKKKKQLLRKKKINSSFFNSYKTNPEFLFYSNIFTQYQNVNKMNTPTNVNPFQIGIEKLVVQEKLNYYSQQSLASRKEDNLIGNHSKKKKENSNIEKLSLFLLRKKTGLPLVSMKAKIHSLILQNWKSQQTGSLTNVKI